MYLVFERPLNRILDNKLFCQFSYSVRKHEITSRDFKRDKGAYNAWFEEIPDSYYDDFAVYIKSELDIHKFTLVIEDKICKMKYTKTDANPLTLILDFAAIVKEASLQYSAIDEEWAKWGF